MNPWISMQGTTLFWSCRSVGNTLDMVLRSDIIYCRQMLKLQLMSDGQDQVPSMISIISKIKVRKDNSDNENSLSRLIRNQGKQISDRFKYLDSQSENAKKSLVSSFQLLNESNCKEKDRDQHPHKIIAQNQQLVNCKQGQQPLLKIAHGHQNQLNHCKSIDLPAQFILDFKSIREKGKPEETTTSNTFNLQYNQFISKSRNNFKEERTKKIEFKDIDRYNEQIKRNSSEQTKIRAEMESQHLKRKPTQLMKIDDQSIPVATDSTANHYFHGSSEEDNARQLKILEHKYSSTLNFESLQLKEMIGVIRWILIEEQKIQTRKMISKIQTQLRKLRLGWRTSIDSGRRCKSIEQLNTRRISSRLISSRDINSSNQLKFNEFKMPIIRQNLSQNRSLSKGNSQVNLRGMLSSRTRFNHHQPTSPTNDHDHDYDYGMLASVQKHQPLAKTSIRPKDARQKIQKLQDEIRLARAAQSKTGIKLSQLQNHYNILLKQKKYNEGSFQLLPSSSMIKRHQMLVEKANFLRESIMESRNYYQNRIRILKNENSLTQSESQLILKDIMQIDKCLDGLTSKIKLRSRMHQNDIKSIHSGRSNSSKNSLKSDDGRGIKIKIKSPGKQQLERGKLMKIKRRELEKQRQPLSQPPYPSQFKSEPIRSAPAIDEYYGMTSKRRPNLQYSIK